MLDNMSTVDTDPNGPRGLTDDELAIARRASGSGRDAEPERGAAPDDSPPPGPAPPVGGAKPTRHPPGTPGADAADDGTDEGADALVAVTVLALYTTGMPAAGWVHIDGAGWRRLGGAGLVPVAAAARTAGGQAVVRFDATDTITEMYVW